MSQARMGSELAGLGGESREVEALGAAAVAEDTARRARESNGLRFIVAELAGALEECGRAEREAAELRAEVGGLRRAVKALAAAGERERGAAVDLAEAQCKCKRVLQGVVVELEGLREDAAAAEAAGVRAFLAVNKQEKEASFLRAAVASAELEAGRSAAVLAGLRGRAAGMERALECAGSDSVSDNTLLARIIIALERCPEHAESNSVVSKTKLPVGVMIFTLTIQEANSGVSGP